MKKRILLLFVAMIGMATSFGWAQEDGSTTPEEKKLTQEEHDGFPNKSNWKGKYTFIYANGNPITITESTNGSDKVKISVDGTEESLEVEVTKNPVIIGGSKNGEVENSTITMISGTINMLFGGGYGEVKDSPTTAKVTGATNITVSGGTITNSLLGGGLYYSQSKTVAINLSGTASVGANTGNWVICGGFESGVTKLNNPQYPAWEESTNTVEKGTLTITGGSFCYIGIGGTDGTQGYVKEATATISNANIVGLFGNGSNGASDKVSGTITNCTFAPAANLPVEIASINRGHVKDVTLTFKGCTFPAKTDSYVGGTASWKSGYKGSQVQVINPGTISYTFKECTNAPTLCLSDGLEAANVEVTGAKVKVAPFSNGVDAQVTTFTLAAGNTWAFNDGMEITETASLTNSGTLKVGAPDVASLTTAIKVGANEIDLVSGTTYELEEPVIIEKALTLTSDGEAKATIKGNLVVEAENASIKNLAFNCESTGSNYWLKNAITLFGNNITVNDCAFTGSAKSNQFVANGIVIFPTKASEASYAITGNTFTYFNQEVGSGEDYWTSTALLLCDKTSITKKNAGQATTIPALSSWNEASLADADNKYTECFANYIHQTENSYVYDVTTNANAVADGINSIAKDKTGTIVAKDLKNEAILAAVKTLKPSLEGKFIVKSQEGSIVSNANSVSSGSVYVLNKNTEGEYELKQQTKDPGADFSKLTASTIEAGQSLSTSILTGGTAKVAGVFSWKVPATVVETGDQTYTVVFTPADLITYNTVETGFTFKNIKQYYTVQIGKCANGHLEIVNANTANKYENGSKLTIKPVADAHYEFDKYLNENGFEGNNYTVSDNDATLTAQFKAVMRKVTVYVTGTGSVSINGESKENNATLTVQEGTVLTVQAVPGDGQVLGSLKVGEKSLNGNTVTVGSSDLAIAASFDTKPTDKYVVKVSAVPNGKINLYDAKGNIIASGSSVEKDVEISVVAVPDLGYKLEDGSLKNGGTAISKNKLTVSADATITATFIKQKFEVSTNVKNGTVEVTKATKEEKQVKENEPSSYDYGTELTATAKANDGYKLLSLVVNGKEIPNGGSFVVTAKTTVTAVMAKLAEIKIDETPQYFTYDENAKAFVVKTTPAGIGGFTVKYGDGNETPTNAAENKDKAYKVTITRDADNVYAAVKLEITGGLIIKAAQLKGVAIPTLDESSVTTTNDGGTYKITTAASGENNNIATVTFTPTDKNFAVQTFYVPGKDAVKCTYNSSTPKTYSAKVITRAGEPSSLTIAGTGTSGTVKVLNGGVETTDLYVGQTVTLQAIPNAGYAADATWDSETTPSNTKVITLAEGANKVSIAFKEKVEPGIKLTIPNDMVYNGSPFAGQTIAVAADSPVKGWDLSFDGTPTDAGTYKIYASRMENENYLAVNKTVVGTFKITPKVVEVSNPIATDILQGQSLAQSVLSGTADTDGTFEWVDATQVLSEDGTDLPVRFVPTGKNYSEKTGLTANVTVTKTGVTIRTLNLTVTGQENGTVSMTLDGTKVEAGATVTEGQELAVTATANNGYEASVQIDGSERTTYTIGESNNVVVKVTFTPKTTTPDPEEPSVVIDVTGVSIDTVSKTLAIGESFALKATVKPANADNKDVSWSSSDATIASVDKDGNVKALKAGTCKITATTDDGGFKATCEVTVTIATGIDEILANNRIYTEYGQIVIEPIAPLEVLITDMTGRIVYHGRTAEKITVSVSGGMYVVRLAESNRAAATKVIVK